MMKNIIILLVFLGAFGTIIAQTTHNTPVDEDATMTVKVITPFLIWDITDNNDSFIDDVIKGQTRTLAPAEGALLFEMQKEADYEVRINLSVPQPVDGVNITAYWFWSDTPPDWSSGFPNDPINGQWRWYGSATQGFLTIMVTEINATNAGSTGIKTFTANAEGWYHGI